ncbi:succinate dehydrogenase/fumarate reductase flavoprotein subunit [Anthocerotibacter panamensis]|uniref:succinate dehydrogenase/fumarate reductase flavoprotein subunit n=1 Tax=Anthocerotibacter panamensis TaxID=2857077 RepID=UPI001C4078BE|nr:succinate dehydrogenase/fumarate reductase flavoprotein subunit [Anthocerotibacter panamensis]
MREHDVIVVGGGLAGSRAALAIAQNNPRLKVALISKVHPIRSHSVAAQGGIAAALKNVDNHDDWLTHAFDTVKGSDYLADQNAVAILTRDAPEVIIDLEHLGVLFSRQADGRIAQRPFGGHTNRRTCYAADKTGHAILHELVSNLIRLGTELYQEWYVLKLIYEEGQVKGVVAYCLETGEIEVIRARAVLFATGGYGRVYNTTSNDFASTGDGLCLTAMSGLPLQDMEFVQFHPTGLYPVGVLISEAVRGEGAYLVNGLGERFMANYPISRNKMELAPRDITSRNIELEIRAGRGINGGPFVHLDVRHLGREKILSRIPFAREEGMRLLGIDCIDQPLPVRPTVHYSMGGIPTTLDGQVMDYNSTPVPGFFAAGECACLSVHGANRLGSNSLLECVVFGKRVGEKIAQYAEGCALPQLDPTPYLQEVEERVQALVKQQGKSRVHEIRSAFQDLMTAHCGIYRDEMTLKEGLEQMQTLKERYQNDLHLDDRTPFYNMELTSALELRSLLTVGEVIMASALSRRESRGAHTRNDYETRDDQNFLRHTLGFLNPEGTVTTATRPVDLSLMALDPERFTPQERKY